VIELRTHGFKPTEIAQRLGISRGTVHHRLSAVYQKAGFNDVALLTRWAIQNGLDEALPPETEEERQVVVPRVRRTKTRIRIDVPPGSVQYRNRV
jgi:hypothetical protein